MNGLKSYFIYFSSSLQFRIFLKYKSCYITNCYYIWFMLSEGLGNVNLIHELTCIYMWNETVCDVDDDIEMGWLLVLMMILGWDDCWWWYWDEMIVGIDCEEFYYVGPAFDAA